MPIETWSSYPASSLGLNVRRLQRYPVAGLGQGNEAMKDQLKKLPTLCQAQLLTEMRTSPAMTAHIVQLLAEPEPYKAILMDQYRTIAEVYTPGTFPANSGWWPVLQEYVRASMRGNGLGKIYWSRAQETPAAMGGLGDVIQELTDWWKKDGQQIFDQYGKPMLVQAAAGITGSSSGGTTDTAAQTQALVKQAQEEQRRKMEEEKMAPKSTSTVVVGLGIAAALAAAVAAVVLLKRRKK